MEFVMVNRLAVLVPSPKAAGPLVLGHPEALLDRYFPLGFIGKASRFGLWAPHGEFAGWAPAIDHAARPHPFVASLVSGDHLIRRTHYLRGLAEGLQDRFVMMKAWNLQGRGGVDRGVEDDEVA